MESGIKTLTATDLNTTTTQKLEAFGAIGQTQDGRRYRYAQAGGAVTGGNLVIAPSLTAAHQNIAVQSAAAAGATQLQVTLGAAAATQDQYAEGFLTVGADGSGVPVVLKIKGNTAGASSGVITVSLATNNPLPTALTTSNVVSLAPSRFSSVTASATAGVPVGVAVVSIASGSCGWVQVYGEAPVVNDAGGSLSANVLVKQSATVAGAVQAGSTAGDISVGRTIQSAAASKAGLALITLD